MRIIAGKFKGKTLHPPAQFKARPTTDRARESLFNVLDGHFDFDGKSILDLFAGTGAISIESVSRGAAAVTAVDIEPISKKFIGQTCREWGIGNIKVIHADVFALAKRANASFDLVFADPPYAEKRIPLLPDLILNSGWLKPEAILVLEHGASNTFEKHTHFMEHRAYGHVHFSFFRAKSAES